MRSLVLDFERRELREEQIAEPGIAAPTEVLFRIHETGICGTDRDLVNYRILPRTGDARRIVLGHEALGQVVECGPAVRGLEPGDWVVPTVRRACDPPCPSCARDRADLCLSNGYAERGILGLDGYFTEFAVDDAAALVRVPAALERHAILLEPLSVVEKAIARMQALRQSDGRDALVLGLGPIGMLAAMTLRLLGYEVTICSRESEDHSRVAAIQLAGVRYTRTLAGRYDAIIECAGSAAFALAALSHLGPCGVFVTLGARRTTGEMSFIDLILGNQTLAGAVNADRASFERGVCDLARFDAAILDSMIERVPFAAFRSTLGEAQDGAAKFVHRMAE